MKKKTLVQQFIPFQIGAKLNKLTPKEIRKPKNWTLKKTPKSAGDFEPMSFDNIQWREPGVRGTSAKRDGEESANSHVLGSESVRCL